MQDFEKLGAFYIGRRYDTATQTLTDEPTLYDAKDLTTHAMIIGMTGSGKTGLGIGLIEEAAIDHVPVIAIDPKGDLGNLLLSFPALAPEDFEPWIDPAAALEAGRTPQEHAAATAELWRKGLGQWGQGAARIAQLRSSAEFSLYTPGSTASTPISVLKSLTIRPEQTADADAFRERVQSTVQSLLTLLDIDSDPLTSREHILLSNILSHAWSQGLSLSLADLIAAVQTPPLDRVGVMDIESFYPSKDRFSLAMRINNLLAAPGFEVWTQGAPLDVQQLLHSRSGKPRVSVISIAHLNDAERMFFVTTLLGEIVSWMRAQSGSASLRAILYMDEVLGYLPPVANPPSKPLFLTLLKQARAYGVGLVLATQNPIDLDYKALSNIGTWMIGRLQTTRDVDRVRTGLESAAGSENLALDSLDATLAGMPKRCFLLNNVHDKAPTVFQTRWVMSYLAGPLTTDQIKRLARKEPAVPAAKEHGEALAVDSLDADGTPPLLDPSIRQMFVPIASSRSADEVLMYVPGLIVAIRTTYQSTRPPINLDRDGLFYVPVGDGPTGIEWDRATALDLTLDELDEAGAPGATYADCAKALADPRTMARTETQVKRWYRSAHALELLKSEAFKAYSSVGETEGEFRARLQELGNQERDRRVAALRRKYEQKIARLQDRLRRAEQAVAREADQARTHKIDTALTFGTALLGALLGRKAISTTQANRVGTAIRKAGRSSQQSADVRRAEETVTAVRNQLSALEAQFDREVEGLEAAFDAQAEPLEVIEVRPKLADVTVPLVAVGWLPYVVAADGSTRRA